MLFPTHKKKEGETKGKSKQETERKKKPVVIGYWEIQLEAEQVKSITFPACAVSSSDWVTHQSIPIPTEANQNHEWVKAMIKVKVISLSSSSMFTLNLNLNWRK